MSKLKWALAAVVSVAMTLPAAAQVTIGGIAKNEAECQAQFRLSDRNGDNVLSPREVSLSRGSIPTALAGQEVIYRQDFIAACYATVPHDD
jgi:hypothetical protein